MKDLKIKNSISKNVTKFKREVTMPEIENREHKSASENAKTLKHGFKSKMKSMKQEKWKNKALHAWPVPKDPREASCRQNHHQQMVVK